MNILVLADVHEGGEWFGIIRTLTAAKEAQNSLNLSLVGFAKKYLAQKRLFKQRVYIRYSKAKKPMSFFKNLYANFRNASNALSKAKVINEVDIVLASHYLFAPHLYFLRFVKGKKIIFYFQGIKSDVSTLNFRQVIVRALEIFSLLAGNVIITPSRFSQKYVKSLLGPLSFFKNFYIIPNTATKEFFQKRSKKDLSRVRDKVGVSQKQKIILYSGRFSKYKGIENLVTAFARFARHRKGIILVIAYPDSNKDKELFDAIKKVVTKNGLEKKVKFIADLKRPELICLYQISDVLVLASQIEMAPLVIIEAIASGTPCIGTRVGNIPELLSHVEPRLILPNNSPNIIYRKFEFFFGLKDLEIQKIRRLSYVVAKNYSPEFAANKFLFLINSLERK